MKPLTSAYHENFQRGSVEFPFDYHFINPEHPRFVMPFHYHGEYELLRVIKGGLSINLNERHYQMQPGDCLFISDGVVHGGEPANAETVYECVVFDLAHLFDVRRPEFGWLDSIVSHQISLQECFAADAPEEIRQAFTAFFQSTGRRSCALVMGSLLTLMGQILEHNLCVRFSDTMSSRYLKHLDKASQLFRFIFDNYASDITLNDMAKTVDLNPMYFCRYFKELTSCRPMDYLNRFRIDCAAIMLNSTSDPINQIAYSCGFKDPCYFTKMFQRYKHTSPRSYRRLRDRLSGQENLRDV